MSGLMEILERVHDRESFLDFVRALAADRELAEEMETTEPGRYALGGACDWQTQSISAFLLAATEYFDERPLDPPATEPSWRMFAEFLWCGKIME